MSGEEVFVADWDAMLFAAKNSLTSDKTVGTTKEPIMPLQPLGAGAKPLTGREDDVLDELDELKGLLGLSGQGDMALETVAKNEPRKHDTESIVTKSKATSSSSISRTERNRLAARRCRQRRKDLLGELAERYTLLQEENQNLRRLLMGVLSGSIDRNAVSAMMGRGENGNLDNDVIDAARRAATGQRYNLPQE